MFSWVFPGRGLDMNFLFQTRIASTLRNAVQRTRLRPKFRPNRCGHCPYAKHSAFGGLTAKKRGEKEKTQNKSNNTIVSQKDEAQKSKKMFKDSSACLSKESSTEEILNSWPPKFAFRDLLPGATPWVVFFLFRVPASGAV